MADTFSLLDEAWENGRGKLRRGQGSFPSSFTSCELFELTFHRWVGQRAEAVGVEREHGWRDLSVRPAGVCMLWEFASVLRLLYLTLGLQKQPLHPLFRPSAGLSLSWSGARAR